MKVYRALPYDKIRYERLKYNVEEQGTFEKGNVEIQTIGAGSLNQALNL